MNKTRCCVLRPQHLQRRSYLDRGRLSRPMEQEAGVEPAISTAHGKDDMNIGGVDASEQQQ